MTSVFTIRRGEIVSLMKEKGFKVSGRTIQNAEDVIFEYFYALQETELGRIMDEYEEQIEEEDDFDREYGDLYDYEAARTCTECGDKMIEGFVINDGSEYFCSEQCLHKHYTEEEWLELYDDGNSDSYWTAWYE